MALEFLNRDKAPFGSKVWEAIDRTVTETARGQLVGRRFLSIDGPYGIGLISVERRGQIAAGGTAEQTEAGLAAGVSTSMPAIYKIFRLGLREIKAFEEYNQPLNLTAAVQATMACAKMEDQLIFKGNEGLGLEGLLTATGRNEVETGDWKRADDAFEDIVSALQMLDARGFSGPYALALTPHLYNQLYRVYENRDIFVIQQIEGLVKAGIYKAPVLERGGVLVATGNFIHLILGQDFTTSFVSSEGLFFNFAVFESVLLRINDPAAICVLREVAAQPARRRGRPA